MTKIKLNTQNIVTINNELDTLLSYIQSALLHANNITIPYEFRKEDVTNAINVLNASYKNVEKTITWVNALKNNYKKVTEDSDLRLKKIDDNIMTEKGLIVK